MQSTHPPRRSLPLRPTPQPVQSGTVERELAAAETHRPHGRAGPGAHCGMHQHSERGTTATGGTSCSQWTPTAPQQERQSVHDNRDIGRVSDASAYGVTAPSSLGRPAQQKLPPLHLPPNQVRRHRLNRQDPGLPLLALNPGRGPLPSPRLAPQRGEPRRVHRPEPGLHPFAAQPLPQSLGSVATRQPSQGGLLAQRTRLLTSKTRPSRRTGQTQGSRSLRSARLRQDPHPVTVPTRQTHLPH